MTAHATLASLCRHALVSVDHDLCVSEALAVVRAHRVHHLPVTQGDALVGVLCSCDLHAAPADESVHAIMKAPVVTLAHDDSVLAAVCAMNLHHTGSVVLMDGARACAVLTRADLIVAQPALAALFVTDERCCEHTPHAAAPVPGACLRCAWPASAAGPSERCPAGPDAE